MILLIIGTHFFLFVYWSVLITFFIQQMLPCVFTQSTCYLKYFAMAMPRLSTTSHNLYERSYLERGIDVSGFHERVLPPLLTDGLIGYSGQKLFYTYCMDGHLLHNAHDFPVVRKEKRRRCGEGTIYEAK